MRLSISLESTTAGDALRGAAERAWTAMGSSPEWIQVTDVPTIRLVSERICELLFPQITLDGDRLKAAVAAVNSEDWSVQAVVHVAQMGAAHDALRGCGAKLQAWWSTSDGSICFGSAEET